MVRRKVLWIGAAAAAAVARVTRRAYHARPNPPASLYGLTVRPTVAPELVDDLADLLRRVAGRASSDEGGTITITFARGADTSGIERDLRAVLERWSEMHPGVRVRITPSATVPRRGRRPRPIPDESEAHTRGELSSAQPTDPDRVG
jgi:hypothetical protein